MSLLPYLKFDDVHEVFRVCFDSTGRIVPDPPPADLTDASVASPPGGCRGLPADFDLRWLVENC